MEFQMSLVLSILQFTRREPTDVMMKLISTSGTKNTREKAEKDVTAEQMTGVANHPAHTTTNLLVEQLMKTDPPYQQL